MKWEHVQQSITVLSNGVAFGATVNGDSASGNGVDFAINAHPLHRVDPQCGSGLEWAEDGSIDLFSG